MRLIWHHNEDEHGPIKVITVDIEKLEDVIRDQSYSIHNVQSGDCKCWFEDFNKVGDTR